MTGMKTGSHTAPPVCLPGWQGWSPQDYAATAPPHCIAISCFAESSNPTSQSCCLGMLPLEAPTSKWGTAGPALGHWPGSHHSELLASPHGSKGEDTQEEPLQRGPESSKEALRSSQSALVPGRPGGA